MVMGRSKRASLGLGKCDSNQGGVEGIGHECQLMERCDGHDHEGGVRECGKVRHLSGGLKVVRNLFQLMERYDDHGGDVRGCGKVRQLSGNVTVLSEV